MERSLEPDCLAHIQGDFQCVVPFALHLLDADLFCCTELEEPVFGRLQKPDPYADIKKVSKYI